MEGVGGRVLVMLLVLVPLVMVQAYVAGPNNRRYPDYIVQPRYQCNDIGYFAHPKNCSWFIRCSDPYNISIYWADYFECPPGTAFAEKIDICIPGYHANSGCLYAFNPNIPSEKPKPVKPIQTETPKPTTPSYTVVCSYENERRLEPWMRSRYCMTDACHDGNGNNLLCEYYAECKIINGEYKPAFVTCSDGMKYSFKENKCTYRRDGVCPTSRFGPNTIFVSGK